LQLIELLAREWLHGMGIDELRHRGVARLSATLGPGNKNRSI
jgi:hypothetical protein